MPAMKKSEAASSCGHLVKADRFKLLPVGSKKVSIRQFVEANGVTFAPGRGFYQLTKPETIQAYKEIVAVRKSDGLQVSGADVRALLKIPASAAKFKFTQLPDFDVFVQSTSYNRVLMPGTLFLYEVSLVAGSSPFKRGGASSGSGAIAAHSEKRNAPAPTYTAGCNIELVFSFDTTGSMYSCLAEVRKNLQTMIARILTDIPNIRVSVFAHGDYCDRGTYVTKHIDFSKDKNKLVNFVKNVASTGGGDWEECYELVMQEARTKLSWTPGSQRALVMIGDAIPHSVSDYKTHYKEEKLIDWRKEADELLKMGCRVYSVQHRSGYSHDEADRFWGGLAYKTYGHHLTLENWDNVRDFIMAIAFKEQGEEQLEAYRQEVIKRTPGGGLNSDLHALFDGLVGGGGDGDDGPSAGGAISLGTLADAAAASGSSRKRKAPTSAGPASKKGKTTATKKTPAKKAPVKTAATKRALSKTTSAKKTAVKAALRKVSAKATSTAKKAAIKKAAVKKAAVKKAAVKKAAVKRAPAKKAPAKKAPAKKAPAKKAPAKKAPAKKAPVKKAPAKKAPAKKVPVRRAPVKKAASGRGSTKKATAARGRGRR